MLKENKNLNVLVENDFTYLPCYFDTTRTTFKNISLYNLNNNFSIGCFLHFIKYNKSILVLTFPPTTKFVFADDSVSLHFKNIDSFETLNNLLLNSTPDHEDFGILYFNHDNTDEWKFKFLQFFDVYVNSVQKVLFDSKSANNKLTIQPTLALVENNKFKISIDLVANHPTLFNFYNIEDMTTFFGIKNWEVISTYDVDLHPPGSIKHTYLTQLFMKTTKYVPKAVNINLNKTNEIYNLLLSLMVKKNFKHEIYSDFKFTNLNYKFNQYVFPMKYAYSPYELVFIKFKNTPETKSYVKYYIQVGTNCDNLTTTYGAIKKEKIDFEYEKNIFKRPAQASVRLELKLENLNKIHIPIGGQLYLIVEVNYSKYQLDYNIDVEWDLFTFNTNNFLYENNFVDVDEQSFNLFKTKIDEFQTKIPDHLYFLDFDFKNITMSIPYKQLVLNTNVFESFDAYRKFIDINNIYGEAIGRLYELRNLSLKNRVWIMFDFYTAHAYYHSGNPIVGNVDALKKLFSWDKVSNDVIEWGIGHEVGHNLDIKNLPNEAVDVSCNVYSIYFQKIICELIKSNEKYKNYLNFSKNHTHDNGVFCHIWASHIRDVNYFITKITKIGRKNLIFGSNKSFDLSLYFFLVILQCFSSESVKKVLNIVLLKKDLKQWLIEIENALECDIENLFLLFNINIENENRKNFLIKLVETGRSLQFRTTPIVKY